MIPFDITILTDDHYLNKTESAGFLEDQIVQQALQSLGIKTIRKSWADQKFDWSDTKAAIFRTTWDYFHRKEEWESFLDQASSKTELINSIDTVRWNMDKHYLYDLSQKGIRIPETIYLEKGETRSLNELQAASGWSDMILKPCFAGTARHTYRLNQSNLNDHEKIFSELIANEAFMLQPFLNNVVEQGEISILIIGGEFSHAVIKRAKDGDFRVQSNFGGSVELYNPTPEEIDFSIQAVAQCNPQPIYARVDIVKNNENELALIELELIEPEMWFVLFPEAAIQLAKVVHQVIS